MKKVLSILVLALVAVQLAFAAYGTDRFRRRRICAVETGRY